MKPIVEDSLETFEDYSYDNESDVSRSFAARDHVKNNTSIFASILSDDDFPDEKCVRELEEEDKLMLMDSDD